MNTNHLDARAMMTSGLAEQIARSVSEPWLAYLQKRQQDKQLDRQSNMQERQWRKQQLADALTRAQTLGVAPDAEGSGWMRGDGGDIAPTEQAAIAAAQALFQKQQQRQSQQDQVSLARAVANGDISPGDAARAGMDPRQAVDVGMRFQDELKQRRLTQDSTRRLNAANATAAEARAAGPGILDRIGSVGKFLAEQANEGQKRKNESDKAKLITAEKIVTALDAEGLPLFPEEDRVIAREYLMRHFGGDTGEGATSEPIANPVAQPQAPGSVAQSVNPPPVAQEQTSMRDVVNQDTVTRRAREILTNARKPGAGYADWLPLMDKNIDNVSQDAAGTLEVLARRMARKMESSGQTAQTEESRRVLDSVKTGTVAPATIAAYAAQHGLTLDKAKEALATIASQAR